MTQQASNIQSSGIIETDRGPFEPLPEFAQQFTFTIGGCERAINNILLQVNAALEEKMLQRAGDPQHRLMYDQTAVALLNLEVSLLTFQEHPSKNGFGLPLGLPAGIMAEGQHMLSMVDALYGGMSGKQWAEYWIKHALSPGKDNVHLSAVEGDFVHQMGELRTGDDPSGQPFRYAEEFHWGFPHSGESVFRSADMPERVSVKVDGKTRKGWADVTYDPERALCAVLALLDLKAPGAQLVVADREKLYEAELERRMLAREQHREGMRPGV